ncbi:acyl-CoA dehydrogenase [Streptomyces sp. NPDC058657]|uniref:acyl-CoA dehydrogenase n=1 Tax=unclassified Streptomyces TaxID=2593676 RepID=UPI00365E4276
MSAPEPRVELSRIALGVCPPEQAEQFWAALAPDGLPVRDGTPGADGTALPVPERLRRLTRALPPAEELLRDPARLAAVQVWAAVADPSLYMAVLNHYVLCLGSIVTLAGDTGKPVAQRKALENGHAKGMFLVTEIGSAGSHLAPRTTARFDPVRREFVLTTPDAGAAKFTSISRSGVRQTGAVCARVVVDGTDRGVFSFAVDLSDEQGPAEGVEFSGPLEAGALPLGYALVRFHQVRVPYEQWLRDTALIDDRGAFHDPLASRDARLGRTMAVGQGLWGTLPAALAAMARECAVQALRFSTHRRSNGRMAPGSSVLAYRPQQHALLGALAEAFVLTCAGNAALETWQRTLSPGPGAPVPSSTDALAFSPWAAVDRFLPLYKVVAARGAERVAAECQRRSGLAGFLDVNRLSAYQGFAHAFASAGGDNQLILLDTGRSLVEDSKETEGPDGRHGPQAGPGDREDTGGQADWGDPEDMGGPGGPADPGDSVDSPAWWPLIAQRAQRVLAEELRESLRARAAAGADGLELWNPLLSRVLDLADLAGNRLAAAHATQTLRSVRSPELRSALRPLLALYGVAQARRSSGTLLTSGVLTPEVVRSLPEAMDRLCDRLLPHLALLEDGLAFPGGPAPAPLGAADYATALAEALGT